MSNYRIILNGDGLYEVEKKSLVGWSPIKELNLFDGYYSKTFTTIERAEEYIEKIENKCKRTVVKEI